MRTKCKLVLGIALTVCTGCGYPPGKPVEKVQAKAGYQQLGDIEVAEHDWPWWRGPDRNGKDVRVTIPTEWNQSQNIAWKSAVPGEGHSSPILWQDKLFLTTADMEEKLQRILCYNRDTGDMLWSLTAHAGGFMNMHSKNTQASATAACDGERVFAAFINSDALFVTAVDINGKLLWQTKAGDFRSEHGYGSSPVLYKSLVIVNGDNPGSGFVAALHRQTGEVIWRIARDNVGSYCTPIVGNIAGRPQLVITGNNQVASYDPETGNLIWTCEGPATTTANTVAFDDKHVYASGGYPQRNVICVRADGTGDVTDTHLVWTSTRGVSYEPSPLAHDGFVYFADNGVCTCFNIADGSEAWKKRLGGAFSSSFTLVGNLLLISNEQGVTFVLDPSKNGQVIAKNDLGERIMASPAVGEDRLFIRTQHHLYCIAAADKLAQRKGSVK